MAWDDPSHPHLGFVMDCSRRVQGAFGGSFIHYSLGELEREYVDEVGSIERGKKGCLLPWRALGGFGYHYFVVITLDWRRDHYKRRVHTY
jgi:hypothetical protein